MHEAEKIYEHANTKVAPTGENEIIFRIYISFK